MDKRIKAIVTASMYDVLRVMSKGYFDKMNREQRTSALEQMIQQRWADAEKGAPAPGPRILPETLEDAAKIPDPVLRSIVEMYFDYYRTPRGFHPRSPNSNGSWTATTAMSFMNMPIMTYINMRVRWRLP